jgi:hypothetical protein
MAAPTSDAPRRERLLVQVPMRARELRERVLAKAPKTGVAAEQVRWCRAVLVFVDGPAVGIRRPACVVAHKSEIIFSVLSVHSHRFAVGRDRSLCPPWRLSLAPSAQYAAALPEHGYIPCPCDS